MPRAPLFTGSIPGDYPLRLEHHRQPPHELPELAPKQHLFIIHNGLEAPSQRERRLDGQLHRNLIRNGDIWIVPAHVAHWSYWKTEHEYLLMSLDPRWLAHTAPEWMNPDKVTLAPSFQKFDPLLHQLGLTLKSELEFHGSNNRLYVESLINTFALHVLRHYCTDTPKVRQSSGGLSNSQLKQVNNYINDLIDRDLSLAELAAVVRISPNYFASLFKQSTGVSPHQYVTQRRIEVAKRLLANSQESLVEVAQQVGFANQSHFSTVFRKQTGVTPKAYRQAL